MAREFVVKARIEAKDQASAEIKKVDASFTTLGDRVRASALKMVAVLGTVTAAFRGLADAGRLEGQTNALKIQLEQQGQSFDQFLAKLNEVTRGTVASADLIAASSRALLLGIPADQIASLLEIARASAIATGESVSKAFDDITTGIGRASPLILDNLGLTINLTDAYEKAAASLGKTTEALTQQEKSQALLNEVLRIGGQRVEAFGESQSKLAEASQKSAAAVDNFRAGLDRVLAVLGVGFATVITTAAAVVVEFGRGLAVAAEFLGRIGSALPGVGSAFDAFRARAAGARDDLAGLSASLQKSGADLLALTIEQGKAIAGMEDLERASSRVPPALDSVGTAAGAASARLEAAAESTDELAESSDEASDMLGQLRDRAAALPVAFNAMGEAVLITARRFDQAVESGQRLLAVEAALAQGATQFGNRIQLPGGGSRFTTSPGLFPGLKGGTFTTFTPATTLPDGRIVFP